jgi:hypothetical protein
MIGLVGNLSLGQDTRPRQRPAVEMRRTGCVLLTEDLLHGPQFDGVKIVNPFL